MAKEPSRPSRRRTLSADERALWRTVTRSIAPRERDIAIEPAPGAPAAPKSRAVKKPTALALPAIKQNQPSTPPLMPLGRREKQRLGRGSEKVDGRLDLHGFTQRDAHAALSRFLRMKQAAGAKFVLVITGKGARGGDRTLNEERGVLRRQVPHWLGLPEFRDVVLGFEPANIGHGGEGALYVRLRRLRVST